jgi:autophagy-related protein 2
LEVNTVLLKLDYKPKKVDYRGLRSGHTTEFMNFVILDGADIILRHAILYGIAGFDRLHKTLNDVWMPDVKRNQLPRVLAGLAPVRPIVNVGAGVRDLVVVPMREYRKDGRVVRAIQKGAFAFATKTTSELARLGAKVAIGTHGVLQGAETFLSPSGASTPTASSAHGTFSPSDPDAAEWDTDFDTEPQERRAHSSYADQPLNFLTGIRGAARGLERDLLTARDAIVAVGGGVRTSDTPGEAVRAVTRGAPTIILRPAIGATKALGTALLGAGNHLDPESKRRVGDKYKRH